MNNQEQALRIDDIIGGSVTNTTAGINNANFVQVQGHGITWASGTSTTSSWNPQMYGEKRIISVIVKEITIEISYRQSINYTYTISTGIYGYCSSPDRVWKEIYGLKDGRMTLLEVVQGKHQQAYHVEESFIFDDDKDVKSPNG